MSLVISQWQLVYRETAEVGPPVFLLGAYAETEDPAVGLDLRAQLAFADCRTREVVADGNLAQVEGSPKEAAHRMASPENQDQAETHKGQSAG